MYACVLVFVFACLQFGYLQLVVFIILTSPANLFKYVCDICLVTKTNIGISTTYFGFSAPDVICATLNWSSSKKVNEKKQSTIVSEIAPMGQQRVDITWTISLIIVLIICL